MRIKTFLFDYVVVPVYTALAIGWFIVIGLWPGRNTPDDLD